MVVEDSRAVGGESIADGMWCYLVSLGGRLYALPDDDRTVLLPFISGVPYITPLPTSLVPPYVMGLINVAQRGELLVDLPRLLDLRDSPLAPSMAESQRIVVVGEAIPPESDEYRLAFAIDYGYELMQAPLLSMVEDAPQDSYVRALLETPRGEAALLDLEAVCNAVLQAMGSERRWNEAAALLEVEDA